MLARHRKYSKECGLCCAMPCTGLVRAEPPELASIDDEELKEQLTEDTDFIGESFKVQSFGSLMSSLL